MTASIETRRMARKAVSAHNSCPVEIIPGDSAPKLTGDPWHYETKSGRRIYHPSAYSSRGWSNMVYCHSTVRVVVGAEWSAS